MKLAGAALVALRGQGKAVKAWRGEAWHGLAWRSRSRRGAAWLGAAGLGGLGLSGFGEARRVRAVNNRKETKWH